MISSKLSPRRHNPRPPSVCISKPPILIVPPPPPPEWPPTHVIANLSWQLEGYPPITANLTLTVSYAGPPTTFYYCWTPDWDAGIYFDHEKNHFYDGHATHYPTPSASAQYLEFTVTPNAPFEITVLDYPYTWPTNLEVHDHWKYP